MVPHPQVIIGSVREDKGNKLNSLKDRQVKIKIYPISDRTKQFVKNYGDIMILRDMNGNNVCVEGFSGYPSETFINGKDMEFELT
mgnify:CR=1 FL=1